MPWATLIPLILQYGLPLAEHLFQKWNSTEPVTQADIDALKALAAQTPQTQMRDALARAGVALDSPQAKQLLALVGA